MPTASCPWCHEQTDAQVVVELKRDHAWEQERVKQAEALSEALWTASDELTGLLEELRELEESSEEVTQYEVEYMKRVTHRAREALNHLLRAQQAFRAARKR